MLAYLIVHAGYIMLLRYVKVLKQIEQVRKHSFLKKVSYTLYKKFIKSFTIFEFKNIKNSGF